MYWKFALAGAALAIAIALGQPSARAGASDYEFQPVSAEVKAGKNVVVAVRLVHKPTGRAVTDAIVFRSRLDMSPDGMGAMTAPLAAIPAREPGIYEFRADLAMAGGWALKLMAKAQGEAETIQGTVVFAAKD